MSDIFVENEKTYKRRKIISNIVTYGFLTIVAIAILIPFYWMLLTSLKSIQEIQSQPPILWLKFSDWKINNYTDLFLTVQSGERAGEPLFPFFTYLQNTVLISFLTTFGTVITTVLASFAFARLHFKGKETLFAILLGTMMVPGEIFILTNFLTINKLGWYDILDQTYLDAILAMTIPFMISPFRSMK